MLSAADGIYGWKRSFQVLQQYRVDTSGERETGRPTDRPTDRPNRWLQRVHTPEQRHGHTTQNMSNRMEVTSLRGFTRFATGEESGLVWFGLDNAVVARPLAIPCGLLRALYGARRTVSCLSMCVLYAM